MANIAFKRGVYSSITGVAGTCLYQSFDLNKSSTEDTCKDNLGHTAGAVYLDLVDTVGLNIAGIPTTPAIGDVVTGDGVQYSIGSVGIAQKNSGETTWTVQAKRYATNNFYPTVVAATTTTA